MAPEGHYELKFDPTMSYGCYEDNITLVEIIL